MPLLMKLGVLVAGIAGIALVSVQPVHAIAESVSRFGPANGSMGYVVSYRTTQVTILSSTVGLYFDENVSAKTVSIENGNLCAVTPPSTGSYGDRWDGTNGATYTEDVFNDYKVIRVNTDETEVSTPASFPAIHVLASTNPDATDCRIQFTLPNSYLTRSSKNGKWMVLIRALVRPGTLNDTQNTFRINTSSGYVAPLGINTTSSATAATKRVGYNPIPAGLDPGTYYDHSIPFGTPCNISAPTTARINFFDTDNVVPGIQPITMKIRIVDVTDNATLEATSFSSGFSKINANGTPYTAGAVFYRPPSGSQSYSWLEFGAQPAHKYRLDVYDQYNVNTLQVTLPYDSIYGVVNCANITPELDPSVVMNPSSLVKVGNTVTATFSVKETNGFSDGVADYSRRVWIERGTNDAYDAADTSLYFVSGSSFTFPAGRTVPAPPGVTSFTTPNIVDGNKICAYYQLTPRPGPDGLATVVPDNPEVVCVPIGKNPKLKVTGGDVWVGGQLVTDPLCSVVPSTAVIDTVDDFDGDENYSGSELATAALGSINGFGSRTRNYTDSFGKTLLFAYTPTTGNYMGASPIKCLNDPFSEFPEATVLPAGSIGAATYSDNARVIRRFTGNLTITGDIKYQDKAYAFGTFPQAVTLVDGDMFINPNVTQLDGLYAVKGNIYTCGSTLGVGYANIWRGKPCDSELTINGAVFTGKAMKLWRSGGAEGAGLSINEKAEAINLNPAYYYAECQRVCTSGMTTVNQQEAPVRF